MTHEAAEMPLNHLGYIVRYHDVRTGFPTPAELEDVVAILTVLTYDFDDAPAYFRWLQSAAKQVDRVIILGSFGGPLTPEAIRGLNTVLSRMGLKVTSRYIENTVSSRIATRDDRLVGYEVPPDPIVHEHPVLVRDGNAADVALEYETDLLGKQVGSVVVATGPGGGIALNGFHLHYVPDLNRLRWIIDPFTFFRRALDTPLSPVPDTTTVSGRRLYFSHVDGDGWNNLTLIEKYRKPPAYSSEVMLKDLLEPYPDLPVSVGLVLGDIDPQLGRGETAAEIARRIYALPQVEVASHTHTHPFMWQFFEHYDQARESALMKRAAAARPESLTQRLRSFVGLARSDARTAREKFVANGNDLPRAYLRDPFRLESEVFEALRGAEALAPAGKKNALYLWSGDTRPFADAIAATRQAGVRNMNGGDTRFDAQFPSVAYIAPLSRVIGDQRQIYSVNTNENNYTGLWTERFYGQGDVMETFRRTGEPVRLRGMNLYYHTYSAERLASLTALRSVLDWVRTQPIAPIRASAYAAIADGFFSTKIAAAGELGWTISDRDGLNTVRFDDADRLWPDIGASRGVIGFSRHASSLYVALDAAVPAALVSLRGEPARSAAGLEAASLAESRWQLRSVKLAPCAISFEAEGYGKGEFAWEQLPARDLTVTARRGDVVLAQLAVSADASGRAAFAIDADAIDPLLVTIECAQAHVSQ